MSLITPVSIKSDLTAHKVPSINFPADIPSRGVNYIELYDNTIIIGGRFDTVDGTISTNISVLDITATLDNTFKSSVIEFYDDDDLNKVGINKIIKINSLYFLVGVITLDSGNSTRSCIKLLNPSGNIKIPAMPDIPTSNISGYKGTGGCYYNPLIRVYVVGKFTSATTGRIRVFNPSDNFSEVTTSWTPPAISVTEENLDIIPCVYSGDLLVYGSITTPEPMMFKIDPLYGTKKTWGSASPKSGDYLTYSSSSYITAAYEYVDNGDILVGGYFTIDGADPTKPRNMMKMNYNGLPYSDSEFYYYQQNTHTVKGFHVIKYGTLTGKILVYGFSPSGYLTLINSDGSHNLSFTSPTLTVAEYIKTCIVLPDGNILIGGNFTTVNGVARNGLALLDPTGTLL